MRVLVTGAAGFIGSHVCDALLARGDEVVGVDNFDRFYPRATKERNLRVARERSRFRFVEADVAADPLPVEGVEVVVHLAAKPGVRPSLEDPVAYAHVNVTGTARVLETARQAGVRRIVLASSSSVYGVTTPAPFSESQPAVSQISPYAATKRAGELLAHSFAAVYGLCVMCLRFFTVYGPRQRPDLAIHRFTALIAAGQPVTLFGDGTSERDYTYITDAVAGTVAAVDWTGRGAGAAPAGAPPAARGVYEVVNIAGGAQVRLDRLVELIGITVGRPVRIAREATHPAEVCRTDADLRVAERLLGYRPRVGIEEGLRHFVRWYEEIHGRQP